MTDVLQRTRRLSSIRNAAAISVSDAARGSAAGNTAVERMRIAIVTETWPPEINGVALTVQSLAQGLAALGHSIEVVRPRQDDEPGGERSRASITCRCRARRCRDTRDFASACPRIAGCIGAGRSQRPDVLYIATEGPLGLTALGAARRLGIPVSTGFHTRFDDYARHYGFGFPDADRLRLSAPFPQSRRRDAGADGRARRLPRSEPFPQRAPAAPRGRHETVSSAPARRSAARASGNSARTISQSSTSAASRRKRISISPCTAFRAIQAQHPAARFVLVGDGPARKTLSAAHPDFVFAGMRRGEDLARHYASGDLFLFPSLSETFGNVTLEALASGVPVVAYDYGAAREHMRASDVGACVSQHDRDAFVASAADRARERRAAAPPIARKRARGRRWTRSRFGRDEFRRAPRPILRQRRAA